MPRSVPRLAFTLLELLVVVAIIAALAGMSYAALGVIKTKEKRLATLNMMSQLTSAMNTYLEKWPTFGDTKAKEFRAAPWQYLYARTNKTTGEFIELPQNRLALVEGQTCRNTDNPRKATHIFDYFGSSVNNLLNFAVVEGGSGRARYAKAIEMRSSAGTPDRGGDDILFRFVSSLDKTTRTYNPGDAGKFILVDKIIGSWRDPLDQTQVSTLDDSDLQKALESSSTK